MAGTLTISTLSDGTNSTSSTNCIRGSAKAWAYYNGSTGTIIGSYNVSSFTKIGTGQYTMNFTTAMPSATYATQVTSGGIAGVAGVMGAVQIVSAYAGAPSTYTTSAVQVIVQNDSGNVVDSSVVSVAIFSS